MKFVQGSRRRAKEYEADLVQYWKQNDTFNKSVQQRPADNAYVFYDGPPFITGVPHHGTLLSSIIKDAVPRYWTMKGKRVERTWGWDCHGLPAEVFTEKKLGIHDKRDIGTKISLEEYIITCRNNMVQTGDLWETTINRIGRWVNFKGAYKTMDKNYMESVWWAFKTLYDKGKIYEGEKVLLYCVRDATPISKAEVAMDNSYQDVTDPSVYVKFTLTIDSTDKLKHLVGSAGNKKISIMAWTTTPWTLPANVAVAVNATETYAAVELENEVVILAEALLPKVLTDEKHNVVSYTMLSSFKGSELVGLYYEPITENRGENAHKIWHADYVSLEDGTGVVHLAPAYGEEDYVMAKENGIPYVSNLDDNGFYTEGEWQGQNLWDVNKTIAKTYYERGIVWKIEYFKHSYPHCHRCGTKLMYRAHPSWFMDIDGQRFEMLEQNTDITWFPGHIKDGRFTKTMESAPDWNLSRDRFWATAMPVWKSADGDVKVIGSYAELKELSGVELEDYHRPWVDDVTFELDGKTYTRIDKVMDCWFESGSMPFAQFHYPFENVEKFEASFPGDFIAEYVGQVRAWFYYLHAVNVGLFGQKAFKNVIVTGTLAGNDGRKMSKSFGNYTDPNELMDQYSADSLRFLLLQSPVLSGEDFSLQDKEVGDIARKLGMLWNMYDFFTLYADVDQWEWDGDLSDPSADLANVLDQWIVSRLHQLIADVDVNMEAYNVPRATKPILDFLDDASNWYVRRSRTRFWKSTNDTDKAQAYRTLHYVLAQTALVLAPFTPFLSEELFRNLTGHESVHLEDWPVGGAVNEEVVARMATTREVINTGLSMRAQAKIKVRQPLAGMSVYDPENHLQGEYAEIVKDELNLKSLNAASTNGFTDLDTEITPELKREGIAREVVRFVQSARKTAGLQVDDRIELSLVTPDLDLNQAIQEHAATITNETLANSLVDDAELDNLTELTVEGAPLAISLRRA